MKKEKGFILTAVLTLLLFPALTFASYPAARYPDVPPVERMQENGEFAVYVEHQGKWLEAGKITYDEFFRERAIDLGGYVSGNEKVRVRLVQKGGEAAHIDSVFLGDRAPLEVISDAQGLTKLSKKDFDVIDGFEKTVDIVFSTHIKDKTLKLTARVEGINRGIPFQFPLDNLCRTMDAKAHFYPYRLNSRKGHMKMDGHLNEVSKQMPFFKEYSRSVTGHPSNYTYGWVWNDDKNLYVAIDFTPDNTMDGGKDYAKLYVSTKSGVKEFKVSVPETRWGKPAFSYTNTVAYQHKVYEFQIPLTEIGSESSRGNSDILLAFSAYGTAATSRSCCYGDGTSTCTNTDPFFCSNTLHGFPGGSGSNCSSTNCLPGSYTYEALIDSIPGGGNVEIVQGDEIPHEVQGIDYKVYIRFDGLSGLLGPTQILKYQGGGFTALAQDPSTYPIGYGIGYDGASVVEFRALKSDLGNPQTMKIIYHASRTAANDYTGPFQFPLHSSIPSLSQWGMIILSLLLAAGALLILRKRKTMTAKLLCSLLIMISISGIAWAFCSDKICLDGGINDWNALGLNPSVTDTKNDSSADDSYEDIFAGYITSDEDYYYFRMDVDVTQLNPN